MERVDAIRRIIPGCAISTDIITGFCNETEEDHQETLSLMEWVGYDYAFMFNYSERPQTLAEETMDDNIPKEVKELRLKDVIDLQQKLSYQKNFQDLHQVFEVLIEGESKRSRDYFMVVFPKTTSKPGDYINVKILQCTSATLIGEVSK